MTHTIKRTKELGLVLQVVLPEVTCNYPLSKPEDAEKLLKELEED